MCDDVFDKMSDRFEELMVEYSTQPGEFGRRAFRAAWEKSLEEAGITEEEWLDVLESRLDNFKKALMRLE